MEAIVKTNFKFPGQKDEYVGKVRDVYNINDEYLVMLVSDRISASTWYSRKEYLTKDKY